MLKITVLEGPDASQVFTPSSDTVVIGRGNICDLVLSDSAVSRRHCALQREEDHFILTDLQSVNGTFLNDLKTRIDSHVLRNGDEIVIGKSRLRVQFSLQIEEAASTVPIDPTETENLPEQNPTLVAPSLPLVPQPAKAQLGVIRQPDVPIVVTVVSGPDRRMVSAPASAVAIADKAEEVPRVSPSERARPRVILRVIEGKNAGAYFESPLEARPFSIGRGKEADFRLQDKAVSRIHVIVRPTAASWELVDNNSLNGTFVAQHSERVDRLELKGGEKIRVAETLLEVEFVSAEDATLLPSSSLTPVVTEESPENPAAEKAPPEPLLTTSATPHVQSAKEDLRSWSVAFKERLTKIAKLIRRSQS
ncbi:MAG TPA: FHA domain-containing protein [Candidatus Binatia bacterium]|nr:FHA domain-containing protein [Candidatus Binatia bacterium]